MLNEQMLPLSAVKCCDLHMATACNWRELCHCGWCQVCHLQNKQCWTFTYKGKTSFSTLFIINVLHKSLYVIQFIPILAENTNCYISQN